jgi:hemerythrin HHE cation binding domain-containing protein
MKRSRELRPLSAEHHQALLVTFQLKKSLEGHPEAAGAPKDLPGLLSLARRFEEKVFRPHAEAEEELLGQHLTQADLKRLKSEHLELKRLVELARRSPPADVRAALGAFADLLERHVRWEERELFVYAEDHLDGEALAVIGGELERRLVLAGQGPKGARR